MVDQFIRNFAFLTDTMKKGLTLILSLIILGFTAEAQVTFEASGQTNVAVGEQFMIRFTVNQQGTNFIGPDFKGLNILSGPNISTNTSYSNINGKMSQSMSVSYTYYLRAVKEGDFKVAPAKITVDNEEYQTKELTVHVSKEPANTNTGNAPDASGQDQNQTQLKENDLFLRASIDKQNPYLGEQVILTYKIYTKVPIAQIVINKLSNFQGFWMKNLLTDQEALKQQSEIIDGEEYVIAELRKFAIFPQKSGKLTIDPLELECVAQIRQANQRRSSNSFLDSFFDDPFFGGTRNIQKILKSNAITLDVKPLPEVNKPLDFSGTVGDFQIKGSINATELKTNDAITLRYQITGSGNIELIDKLNTKFPSDFEVYEPKITNNIITNSASGVSGSRTFEYLLIPRNPGDFEIPPLTFNYFNLKSNSYQQLKTQPFNLKVEKGADYQSGLVYSGANREAIQYIGTDIRHIKTGNFALVKSNYFLFNTTKFIMWMVIPFALFIAFILIWKKQAKKLNNQSLMRHKRATKVARKSLKNAQAYLGTKDSASFYNEISQALWGYLSDKFNIPKAELSKETVNLKLLDKKVKEKTIIQFIETLNHCDYARFAPGDPESTMDTIYNEALEIITKIERELK